MVDSSLLRFLASTEEKNNIAGSPKPLNKKRLRSGSTLTALKLPGNTSKYLCTLESVLFSTLLRDLDLPVKEERVIEEEKRSIRPLGVGDDEKGDLVDYLSSGELLTDITATDNTLQDDEFLQQYTCEHITKVMQSLGAERSVAFEIGYKVERLAFDRARRRSIRQFLRKRDYMWASPDGSGMDVDNELFDVPSVSDSGEDVHLNEMGGSNLESVINVLLHNGLIGTDIVSIMSHTPSLALMISGEEQILEEKAQRKVEVGSVLNSSEELMVDGIDETDTEDVATEVQTVYDASKQILRVLLCDSLGLRKYDARKIIRSCPGLLTSRGSHSAEQVIELMTSLGVSHSALARDKSYLPVLLSRSSSSLFRLVAFLSSDAVRMTVDSIGPLLRRKECSVLLDATALPVLLSRSSSSLFRLVAFLSSDAVRMTVDSIGPLLRRKECSVLLDATAPAEYSSLRKGMLTDGGVAVRIPDPNKLVSRSEDISNIYRRMRSTASFLRFSVGITDLSKVVASYPRVLLLDSLGQVSPVVSFLRDDIGLDQETLPKMIQAFPVILGVSVTEMRSVTDYLISIEVKADSLPKIIRAFPAVLTMNVRSKMKPVVEYLRSIGVVNVGRFITRIPPILGYSVEDELRPKWRFLSYVCECDFFEVVRFPAYFSYPLERVIAPRYHYLKIKGLPLQLVSADDVLRYGDKDFASMVAGDQDGGKRYAQFLKIWRSKVKERGGMTALQITDMVKKARPNALGG
eukprot:CAMPEP_0194443034 /NCGR_PEP_ID=MMETSP0176-20130528/126476_1 /TAXON_ID=216777 /ORGANISM="Proboscia alata, Strain PI-D3" /LENGTH=745 /DNA_ID=CAMNT_0039269227 /DNA_START=385 /DNA_END=2620 /DNA_ORIENTATION=-